MGKRERIRRSKARRAALEKLIVHHLAHPDNSRKLKADSMTRWASTYFLKIKVNIRLTVAIINIFSIGFFDPDGYFFDSEGFDQYGGYYDNDGYYHPGEGNKHEFPDYKAHDQNDRRGK